MHPFQVIAFDADDTLWHNENVFQATEKRFADMLSAYHPEQWVRERLFATETKNLGHFGYGIKGFVLSMIETAIELTEGRIAATEIQTIINWGHDMLRMPIELLPGVGETVQRLAASTPLMLLTKGDLFDQEAKLARSGLGEHFAHVEIVSEKDAGTYRRLIDRLGIEPGEFLMIGNSVKSDVLPVIEAGGIAVHIPYAVTWAHERVEHDVHFAQLESMEQLEDWLARQ